MKRVNPFKGCVTGGRLEGKLESYLDYKGSFFPPTHVFEELTYRPEERSYAL